MAHWRLLFVLPNLDLRSKFELERIAIVGSRDQRIIEISNECDAARYLMEGFKDQRNHKIRPSALIVKKDAPSQLQTWEAAISFRNVYAMSSLIYDHQLSGSLDARVPHLSHSTFFDVYPVVPDRECEGLITSTPAALGFDEPKDFLGQASPGLGGVSSLIQPEPDPSFRRSLTYAWRAYSRRRFKGDKYLTALFRSLELAYHAASLPEAISLHQFGLRLPLWVSSIEILTNAEFGRANFSNVMKMLERLSWTSKELRDRRYTVRHYNKRHRVTFITKLYKDLYDARNDFVHGNPVSSRRLFLFKDTKRSALQAAAPFIYKSALMSYLEKIPTKPSRKELEQQQVESMWDVSSLEECILSL